MSVKRTRIKAAAASIGAIMLGTIVGLELFASTPQGKAHSRASTDAGNGYAGLAARAYDMPPEQTLQVAAAVIARLPNWSIVRTEADRGRVTAEVKHGFGLLKDDVVVQVAPYGRNARVSVASESRIEDGVTGANVNNIRALQAAMDDRLPPAS